MIKNMDMAFLNGLMVENTKEDGEMGSSMVKDITLHQLLEKLKESGKMVKE